MKHLLIWKVIMHLFLFCCCYCYHYISSVTFFRVLSWNSTKIFWTFLLKSTGPSLSGLIPFMHGSARFHASWIIKWKHSQNQKTQIILQSPVKSRNYSFGKSCNEVYLIFNFYNIHFVSYILICFLFQWLHIFSRSFSKKIIKSFKDTCYTFHVPQHNTTTPHMILNNSFWVLVYNWET